MNADLGARLVAAGLVTREELGLALAEVPAHGGALAAELVRQGTPEDAIAGFFVADGFGPIIEAAELDEARGDDRVPAQLAVDMMALPLSHGASGLLVAMADPSDIHAVRELTHVAGVTILPIVARIGALARALSKRFPQETAAASSRREPVATPIDLVRRRDSSEPPAESIEASFDSIVPLTTRLPEPVSVPASPPPPVDVDDLASHEGIDPRRRETADFIGESRERTRRDTAEFGGDREAPRVGEAPEREGRRRDTADFIRPGRDTADFAPDAGHERGPEHDSSLDTPGRETMEQVGALVGAGAPPPDASAGGWGDMSQATQMESIARRAARAQSILPLRLPAAIRHAEKPRGLSPKELGDLSAILASIRAGKTRDDVCRHACRGLAPLGRCAVLLVISKGVLKGREVEGGDLPRDAVQNLWIPTTSRSLLQRVVETCEPYLGPHGESSADAVFRAALGSRGGDVLLMPIVLSGRAVAVLALDEPIADGVVLLERAEVLTRATAEAFRRLILAAKG